MDYDTNVNDKETESKNALNNENQLMIFNLSIIMIYVVILAILLNLEFIFYEKGLLIDQINNTSFTSKNEDIDNYPVIANKLFLFATGAFLAINMQNLVNTQNNSEENSGELNISERNFMATLLIFIATGINHDTLNL